MIPLLSFSEHIQMAIIDKMYVKNQIRMRKTCVAMDSCIDRNSKVLAANVSNGIKVQLWKSGEDTFNLASCERNCVIEEGFERKLKGIPIRYLSFEFNNRLNPINKKDLEKILKVFETWRPLCGSFTVEMDLLGDEYQRIISNVTSIFFTRIRVTPLLLMIELPTLQKMAIGTGNTNLCVSGTYVPLNFLDIKPFAKIYAKTFTNTAMKIVAELRNCEDHGNLRELDLILNERIPESYASNEEILLEYSSGADGDDLIRVDIKVFCIPLKTKELALLSVYAVNRSQMNVMIVPENGGAQFVDWMEKILNISLTNDERRTCEAVSMKEQVKILEAARLRKTEHDKKNCVIA